MNRRRILIVADPAPAAAELETRVRRLGYEVADGSPDLVLVGVGPGGTAAASAAAVAARSHAPAPVVFMGPASAAARLGPGLLDEPGGYVVIPCGDRELRAQIELAIRRGEEGRAVHDLEAFFSLSIDMFCFLDFSGHFRRLNPAWERTLGFTTDELMARPFIEFVHPDDRERTLQQNSRVRGGGQALGFENRYRCRDGSYRWLLWNSAPDHDRGVIYAVARDITARKRAEEERARLVAELEKTLAEVRTLQEILPICSYCRKIRDDEDYWHTVESYVAHHTGSQFSHGICPTCLEAAERQVEDFETE